MTNLFSLSFWFNLNPGDLTPIYKNGLLLFIAILVFTAIISYLKQRRTGESKKFILMVWREIYKLTSVHIFLGIFLFFLSYQRIPFFSSRFWFLIWGVVIITQSFFIFKLYKKIPCKITQAEVEEEYQKYIPR